jgi:hypothetical protein
MPCPTMEPCWSENRCVHSAARSIVGVLGVGFSQAPAGASDSVVRDSIFMVTELCRGGSLREKVLEQMIAGRKVRNQWSCFAHVPSVHDTV